ncbi:AAA family ATPase [Ottowia sp.]|uniref:ATP-dependent nuclease n=1 Tax=Ottowia sp. TaxID=1898956 RepID=UPI0025F940B9|nr:AAA family ATPase [Ottowia sp.]MBK6612977.1 AAA family ATPase [Ottowia sp.]
MGNNAVTYLKINHLQRLRNIELELPEVGVTAIVGVNGSGKSTLLRALACTFQPIKGIGLPQEDYKAQRFFLPYEGCDWNHSSFEVGIKSDQLEVREFKKAEGVWTPLPQNRFQRYVKLIGIGDAVPHIERDVEGGELVYEKSDLWGKNEGKLRSYLSEIGKIMNRSYPGAGNAKKSSGVIRDFLYASLDDRTLGQLTYPSHYMGAGEQKIFEVVKEVSTAPKGSLILIEEPEVSLHNKAMHDLLLFLEEQAEKKELQIIISTHWLGIDDWKGKLCKYSLHVDKTNDAVSGRKGLAPTDQHALSGLHSDIKKITVWVEDEMAKKIVDHVANELNIKKFIRKISVAYSANNLFSVAAAVVIDRDLVDDVLIVGDGDVATSIEAKQEQIEKRISLVDENLQLDGPRAWVDMKRKQAAGLITEFFSPDNQNPESFLISVAEELKAAGKAPPWLAEDLGEIAVMRPLPPAKVALYELAKMKCDTDQPADITNELGRLHARLIGAVSASERWGPYVEPVAARLKQMAMDLGLIEQKAVPKASSDFVAVAEANAALGVS